MRLTAADDASEEREREGARERVTRAKHCYIGSPTYTARASIGSRKGLLACTAVKETADRWTTAQQSSAHTPGRHFILSRTAVPRKPSARANRRAECSPDKPFSGTSRRAACSDPIGFRRPIDHLSIGFRSDFDQISIVLRSYSDRSLIGFRMDFDRTWIVWTSLYLWPDFDGPLNAYRSPIDRLDRTSIGLRSHYDRTSIGLRSNSNRISLGHWSDSDRISIGFRLVFNLTSSGISIEVFDRSLIVYRLSFAIT